MTLPAFFSALDVLSGIEEQFLWTGAESDHARKVMRLGAGDRLDLIDGSGGRATCTVTDVLPDGLELRVYTKVTENLPDVTVTLVQALAKGGRDEHAIEMCTELGIDRIIPWQANRSIVKWAGAKAAKSHQKWVNTVRAATKQSRRAYQPPIEPIVTTAQLTKELERTKANDHLVLITHEQSATPIVNVLTDWKRANQKGTITLIVGPEGGISDDELQAFASVGAQNVLVGPLVLRSSTAGAAALTLANVLAGRWR